MRRWASQFRRAQVVDRATGERLGRVQRFLVDRNQRAVVALLLAEPSDGRPALLVPLEMVANFGPSAVMVEGHPHEVSAEGLVEYPGWKLPARYPVGLPVLTPRGERCGRVGDFRFNFQDGQIEEIAMRDSFWEDLVKGSRPFPAQSVAVFGPDALILANNIRPMRAP